MRSVIIGAALAIVAGPAFAQSMPTDGSNAQPAPGTILLVPAQGMPVPSATGPGAAGLGATGTGAAQGGGMAQGAAGSGGDQAAAGGMPGRGMDGDAMRHMAWMRAHMGGSSFRFRRGHDEVDVHCAAEQPLPVCISAAAALLDKLASMHGPEDNAGGAQSGGAQSGGAQSGGAQAGGSGAQSGGATASPQRP
jgi:hypothetical protein